jgi:putative ABC transport system permease protein
MSLFEVMGFFEIGLVFSILALGTFISFRILRFPDLSVEGTFPLGAAVGAVLIANGLNPWVSTVLAGCAGFAAGALTASLHVRFQIIPILSGILVAVALYSINLRIMGGPNKPLLGSETVFDAPARWLSQPSYITNVAVLIGVVLLIKVALDLMFKTGFGFALRATGSNAEMARAAGINVGLTTIAGLGLANALTAISGALFAQIFGGADVYAGTGVIITGLASVIVGMSIFPSRTMILATFACIFGSIAYRASVGIALNADVLGLRASDLQLVTARLVAVTLILQAGGWLELRLRFFGVQGVKK